MARNCSVAERNIINANGVNHLLYISIESADGVMHDVTHLGDLNLDFMDGASWSEGLDTPVSTGSLVIRRDTTEDSAAPTIGASSINRTSLGSYAPLFEKGRAVLISTATVLQGTNPLSSDIKPMFTGRIDGVHWQDNPMTIDISDIGAWLADAVLREKKAYAGDSTEPGGGPLLGEVIQSMLNDAIPAEGDPVELYEPVTSPFQPYSKDPQDPSNLFPAIRRWAQEIGWELRYRWDNTDQFRLTLFEPPRSKGVPDWTIGPNEYRSVSNLSSNIADIRNEIIVQYKDVDGKLQTVTAKDQTSIDKYGGPNKISRVWQFPSATIRTAENATSLANAVLSDLSEADADQEIEMPYFWPVQIGDLILFQANGDHYDTDQLLAVVNYSHSFIEGAGSTTLQTRGKVAGAFRAWVRWQNIEGGLTPDTRSLALKNFREIRRTPTVVTYGWDAVADDVEEIWAWQKNSPQNIDPPLPPNEEEDRIWPNIKDAKPDIILKKDTVTFDVDVPDFSFIQAWILQPVDAVFARGYPQNIKVLSAPDIPRITNIETQEGATGLFKDILLLNVVDPQARGGVLSVWLNHDFPEDADPDALPDGTLDIAITPYAVTVTDVFKVTGGTLQLFDNIRIHPGAGKRVYFEFVNSKGTSSGKIQFILLSNGGIITPDGILKDNSINLATQIASNFSMPDVFSSLPATGRPNQLGILSTATPYPKLYRWTGSAWTAATPTADLTGVINIGQLAANSIRANELAVDAVYAAAIQVGAVKAVAIDAAAVNATKLSTIVLSETGPGIGIIQIGKLTSIVGTTWIDLNATGTQPVIHSPSLDLRADGSATFSGIVSASQFTAATANFSGGIAIIGPLMIQSTSGSTRLMAFGVSLGAPAISGVDNDADGIAEDLVLKGKSDFPVTNITGNVLKRSSTAVTQPVPCVTVSALGPSNAGNYKQGDLWIDTALKRVSVLNAGAWVQGST